MVMFWVILVASSRTLLLWKVVDLPLVLQYLCILPTTFALLAHRSSTQQLYEEKLVLEEEAG
jgi:hypothetical protein